MDDKERDHVSEIVASAWQDAPFHEIPDDLIEKWQALPFDQEFVPALPRVAWDKLYLAIDVLSQSVTTASLLVAKSMQRDAENLDKIMTDYAMQTRLVQNSLKQFQQMMMQAAIDEVEGAKGNG